MFTLEIDELEFNLVHEYTVFQIVHGSDDNNNNKDKEIPQMGSEKCMDDLHLFEPPISIYSISISPNKKEAG